MHRIAAALALATLAAACGRDRPTPEQRQARSDARVVACVAEQLQGHARLRLARLDTLAQMSNSPLAGARGPHTFAQVYLALAEVRAHESAYVDSALHAEARADSVRYDSLAATFRVRPPSPGSVEENVRRTYLQDFASLRLDPDHPCNRLVEGERPKDD